MPRLLGVALAVLFAVTPAADLVCRALCMPAAAASSPACHDAMPATGDGLMKAPPICPRDGDVALVPADPRHAGVGATSVTAPAHATASLDGVRSSAGLWRPPLGPRPPQACLRSIVLRI